MLCHRCKSDDLRRVPRTGMEKLASYILLAARFIVFSCQMCGHRNRYLVWRNSQQLHRG